MKQVIAYAAAVFAFAATLFAFTAGETWTGILAGCAGILAISSTFAKSSE